MQATKLHCTRASCNNGFSPLADTPKGAAPNAVLYTLVESARANDLDVYAYLKYILESMPNNDYLNHPEILDKYPPWSEELPKE
ncbi:transposase domain-containing protein [Clostridium sp. C105KSO13]|uniref:transposase domain-containing protein n=1 Tax=Clostridium sp. C105KSO13 TaxID=1776045 RepID=UPI000A41353A|nr:transposase domain-containing protein [Clostridium sp. C105KSO13]